MEVESDEAGLILCTTQRLQRLDLRCFLSLRFGRLLVDQIDAQHLKIRALLLLQHVEHVREVFVPGVFRFFRGYVRFDQFAHDEQLPLVTLQNMLTKCCKTQHFGSVRGAGKGAGTTSVRIKSTGFA